MATKIVKCGTLLVVGLGGTLSGCTGGDMGIAMGPNGPVPPESVGTISSYGAPPVSAATQSYPEPLSASPAGSIASSPLPASSSIEESQLAPPSGRMASTSASSGLQWQTGPQAVGQPSLPSPQPVRTQMASLPDPEPQSDFGPAVPEMSPPQEPPLREEASLAPGPDAVRLRPASMAGQQSPGQRAGNQEIQFLPVVGAPQRDGEMLARALSEESGRAGLTIRPASGPVAPIRLKGYFSAFTSGSDTVLVYVWDVLDDKDQRIRRIQGQEQVAGTDADPWSKVDLDTLRKVARHTMSEAASVGSGLG